MAYKTKDKQRYLRYFERTKAQGKKPMPWGRYVRWSGIQPVQIKKPRKPQEGHTTVRTKATSRRLRRGGLTPSEIKRLRGKK
jgi:hypothetical protein